MGDWQQQSGKVPFDVNPLGGHHESEGWVASGQKTTREGAQPHPSTDNRIATLLSMALPTRTRPGFSHRSSLPSGSLHQPLSLLQQRADRRSKKNHNSTADKAEPHYRKLICNIYRYMCVCVCVCVCVYGCPGGSAVKNPPAMQETQARSLGQEDPLEKGMEPTSVFLSGKSHGQRSLVGCRLWGRTESDTTEVT